MTGSRRQTPPPTPEQDPNLHALPGWGPLVEVARSQSGLFLQRQAVDCGLEPSLLPLLVRSGRIHRVQRLLFRLTREPEPLEPLVLAWLWTGRHGVFSHRTALVLHGLLPLSEGEDVHLTVPSLWPGRCRGLPARVRLHTEDLPDEDVVRIGAYPVACVERAVQNGLVRLDRQEVRRILLEAARLLQEPGSL